jgi:hypothetical protein
LYRRVLPYSGQGDTGQGQKEPSRVILCKRPATACCRTKRDALALQARLEAVADWSQSETWEAGVRIAILDVLDTTESVQIDREAMKRRY